MKRLAAVLLAMILAAALCSCGTGRPAAPAETPVPTETPVPETEAPVTPEPESTDPPPPAGEIPAAAETAAWADSYLAFLDDNYDILAALWPEGLTGVGFVDLDRDEVPEMVMFDQGASATLGAQLFDLVDGRVYCVSSTLETARGAFDDTFFSPVTVCTSFFEAFRLSRTEARDCFWVSSANGTMATDWDEVVRFGSEDGALTLTSVCTRWLETDPESGVVVEERYYVGGEAADESAYEAAAAVYTDAQDLGYEARGVFLWNDMQSYDTTYEGLMAMARDAVAAYVPIEAN